MHLSSAEILLIFKVFKEKYGNDSLPDEIAALQGHLSILLEMARRRES